MDLLFGPDAPERVMRDFIASVGVNLFANAPPRPNALALETAGATGEIPGATSLGQALIANSFQAAPIHIPNGGDGEDADTAYKTELVLVRDPAVQTLKMLWWHLPDPRKRTPHNHPWDFRSAILRGGYAEQIHWFDEAGKLQTEIRAFKAGMVNLCPANVYHNVLAVLPGTVTLMDCGPARAGNDYWYINPETGEILPNKTVAPAAKFVPFFHKLNTHLKPKAPPAPAK